MILFSLTLVFLLLGIKYYICLIPILFLIIYQIIKRQYKNLIYIGYALILGLLVLFFPKSNDPPSYGIVISYKENYLIIWSNFQKYYLAIDEHDLELFDIISFNSNVKDISFQALEGEFSFKDYLESINVFKEIEMEGFSFVFKNPLRINHLKNYLFNDLNDYSKYLTSSLLFNINIDSNIREVLNYFNISFLFIVSSLHIYLFYQIETIILKVLKVKKAEKIAYYSLFIFLYFAQFKLSLIKVILLLGNKVLLANKFSRKQILMGLMDINLLLKPKIVFSSTFYYVFIMSFLVIYIFPSLNTFKKTYQKLLFPLFLNLIYLPLTIFNEGKYSLFTPLISLFSSFVSEFIFILIILSLILTPLKVLLNFISYLYFQSLFFINKFNIIVYVDSWLFLIILTILIILFLYFSELKYRKYQASISLMIVSSLIIFSLPLDSYLSSYVYFINVGQGDCCLIHHNKYNILIDTGGSIYKDIGNDILIPFFKRKHINKLDLVFISHEDYDHNGALESLEENFQIDEIIVGSTFYSKDIGPLSFKNLNVYNVGTNDNDQSSAIYLSFLNHNFLFLGDCSKEIEEQICFDNQNLDVDIVKIGHHGSNTSTSVTLLETYDIDEAVISVGFNYYGHPTKEVLSLLESYDIKIRRTDLEGSIYYY